MKECKDSFSSRYHHASAVKRARSIAADKPSNSGDHRKDLHALSVSPNSFGGAARVPSTLGY